MPQIIKTWSPRQHPDNLTTQWEICDPVLFVLMLFTQFKYRVFFSVETKFLLVYHLQKRNVQFLKYRSQVKIREGVALVGFSSVPVVLHDEAPLSPRELLLSQLQCPPDNASRLDTQQGADSLGVVQFWTCSVQQLVQAQSSQKGPQQPVTLLQTSSRAPLTRGSLNNQYRESA